MSTYDPSDLQPYRRSTPSPQPPQPNTHAGRT